MLLNRHLDKGDDAKQVLGKDADKSPPERHPISLLKGANAKAHNELAQGGSVAIAHRLIQDVQPQRPSGCSTRYRLGKRALCIGKEEEEDNQQVDAGC